MNYLATLHYKLHALEFGNVCERIAGNGDDIRELSLLERANLILPTHHCRGHGGRRLDGLARRHSIPDQVGKLGGLRSVWKWADTRPKSNLHAAGNCQATAL